MATFNYQSFTNGTVANATEVNGNFSAVKNFVESQTVQVDGSVKATTASITDGAVTKAKLNDGPTGDVPLVTVAAAAPANNTIGKNGDIWIVV